MKRIAVLTSGGDAPGMNAAVRAVVRQGIALGIETLGVRGGWAGLMKGDARPLGARDVSGIIQLGGTFLGTSRALDFKTGEGRKKALEKLAEMKVDALVAIGGNGTQQGTDSLRRAGFPVVGVASTIDDDLVGAEPSIGFDTALNVALEAIDRLKATGASARRAFLVETMGRDCGRLALSAAVAGGAEAVVVPEVETDPDKLAAEVHAAYERGKTHCIVVVAEGASWNAARLGARFSERKDIGFDVRTTVLGHVQRGGAPTAFDRLLGSQLGAAAVERLAAGEKGTLVGWCRGGVASYPLEDVAGKVKRADEKLLALARVLAA